MVKGGQMAMNPGSWGLDLRNVRALSARRPTTPFMYANTHCRAMGRVYQTIFCSGVAVREKIVIPHVETCHSPD
jgi:hypothetical protein